MIGCFGSAICIEPRKETCRSCGLLSACLERSKQSLAEIGKSGNIDTSKKERELFHFEVEYLKSESREIVSSTRREKLTSYQKSIIENPNFPIKARKLIASVFRKGITGRYIRVMLTSGKNPFHQQTPAILDVACELILNDGINVKRARDKFVEMGHSNKTAISEANNVVTAFLLMGVIGGDMKLRRVE